jgi:hypothetical protein
MSSGEARADGVALGRTTESLCGTRPLLSCAVFLFLYSLIARFLSFLEAGAVYQNGMQGARGESARATCQAGQFPVFSEVLVRFAKGVSGQEAPETGMERD